MICVVMVVRTGDKRNIVGVSCLKDESGVVKVSRVYTSSLMRVITECNHLPFFKIFSNFCPHF